jgi:N-carbamoylputrescine amidase
MKRNVRIALVQMAPGRDPARNLERAAAFIARAAARAARIVVLPELFRTPYFCQSESRRHFRLAEPVPGPTTEALSGLARRYGLVIVAPVFEKRAGGLYHNTAVVLDADGRVAGRYRKMHVPDDPLYYEKFYFTPGDLGFPVFRTRWGRIGVLICWDQWYPEAARLAALGGAEILVYPTAIGWAGGRRVEAERRAWRTIQVSHAIANGLFVACANRTGTERRLRFWGSSFVAGPDGAVLAEAPEAREALVTADCDLGRIARLREEWPFLRDRRVDAYAGLGSRYLDAAGRGR